MLCPFCEHNYTKVIDSRQANDGQAIKRRRQCQCISCKKRFTTYESYYEIVPLEKDSSESNKKDIYGDLKRIHGGHPYKMED